MKNPKAKGNTFEREVAEKLSLWLTKGKEKRACWRSDTSGAAATIWAKKKEEARYVTANAGDIVKIAERGLYAELDAFFDKFVIECKHYKALDFYPPYNKILTTFFEACKREREATGKASVLIMKANNRKILYCQEPGTLETKTTRVMTIHHEGLTLDVYLFDEILKT